MPEQTAAEGERFFYHAGSGQVFRKGNIIIIADGYIMPRLDYYRQYEGLLGAELIARLMDENNEGFIDKVKGIFTLIIIEGGRFGIFNDTNGLKKFFLWSNGDNFIITDRIKNITENVRTAPDYENMALYCLTEHFVKGMTAFSNVSQSLPALQVTFENTLSETQYWRPEDLFAAGREKHDTGYYADRWVRLISDYIQTQGSGRALLTLTGGCDSRLVLAGLLKAGADVRCFSYGDPLSMDVIIARSISEKLGLSYANHYVTSPTSEWMAEAWQELTETGDTLINLHRCHRYQAAVEEKSMRPESDTLFTGLMGGEYLRGIEYDGYIISDFFRDFNTHSPSARLKKAREILVSKSIISDSIDIKAFSERLEYLNSDFLRRKREREFLLAFYIYGSAHHYQDAYIYMSLFGRAVSPFMDIDFLNMIASSDFVSFRHPGGVYNMLWASRFQVMLTHHLLPELSDIPYNKKGFYTADDMAGGSIKYMVRRAAVIKRRDTFPANFIYGAWMKQFVQDQMKCLSPVVAPLFNTVDITQRLNKITSVLNEKQWHYFTNPINLSQIFK